MQDTLTIDCTTERLHHAGHEAMRALLAENRFRCRRILVDLSLESIPFSSLDSVAEAMARTCGASPDAYLQPLREVVLSALDHIGVMAVASSFLARYAPTRLATVLAESERLVVTGRCRWISDLIGARVISALVGAHPIEAWRGLAPWVEADDPWRRRAVTAGANRVLQNPTSDTRDPVRLLATLRKDVSNDVRCGVAQALRTLARHHRTLALHTLHDWATQADDRIAVVIRDGMAALGVTERRRLEAVLAAR